MIQLLVVLLAELGSLSRFLAMTEVHDRVQGIVIENEILPFQVILIFSELVMAKLSGSESVDLSLSATDDREKRSVRLG